MTSTRRSSIWLAPLLALGVLSVACGSNASFQPVGAASPSCMGGSLGGDAVSPAAGVKGGIRWLFRCDKPPVAFRPASTKLADMVGDVQGLGTAGLKSTKDAAAVLLVEDDPSVPWGMRLHGAELAIFKAFAEDRSLGEWLIMVTDVVVRIGKDPIPPTAYRWSRSEVADYVSCGMPTASTDPCRDRFWKAADQIVLAPAGGQPRGR